MSQKWMDVAKANLEAGDEKQFVFPAQYDKKNGWAVLSKKKILFVEEHGFMRTTDSLVFNDPYKDISKVEVQGNQVKITNTNGSTHILKMENRETSDGLNTKLQDLMKKAT